VEPVEANKIGDCTAPPHRQISNTDEAESTTDMSSSEDAFTIEVFSPESVRPSKAPSSRVKVQWSDLLDSRMLALDAEIDTDNNEGGLQTPPRGAQHAPEGMAALVSPTSDASAETSSKRRSRRRRRHLKATASDASTAASRSPSILSSLSGDAMEFFYPHPHTPSQFAGLSTHCSKLSSPVARGGRNVVTVNDILGSDLSPSPQASFSVSSTATVPATSTMAMCTISSVPTSTMATAACPQASLGAQAAPAWMEPSCDASSRTAAAWFLPMAPEWNSPPSVTEWNPPNWESPVYRSEDQANQGEQLMTWLMASGLPACTDGLAEQLYAVAPEAYED